MYDVRDLHRQTSIIMPFLKDDLNERNRKTLPKGLDCPDYPVVTPRSPKALRNIAEQIGRQFRDEGNYDFSPYVAADTDGQLIVLIPAGPAYWPVGGMAIAGACGIEQVRGDWWVTWVYLHPYQRGIQRFDEVWRSWVMLRFPGIRLSGPFTGAGLKLRQRLIAKGLHPIA